MKYEFIILQLVPIKMMNETTLDTTSVVRDVTLSSVLKPLEMGL